MKYKKFASLSIIILTLLLILLFTVFLIMIHSNLKYTHNQGCLITGEVIDYKFVDSGLEYGDVGTCLGCASEYTEVTIKLLGTISHDSNESRDLCRYFNPLSTVILTNEDWGAQWKTIIAKFIFGNKITITVYGGGIIDTHDYLIDNPHIYWIIYGLLIILIPTLIWIIRKKKSKIYFIITTTALSLPIIYIILFLLISFG